MCWDVDAELKAESALHEGGHAAFAWHFSSRYFDSPPFYTMTLAAAPNALGTVPGSVEVNMKAISDDIHIRGAVILAGIFTKEVQNLDITPEAWASMVENRNGTDGTDDYCDALRIAEAHGFSWEDYAAAVLVNLKAAATARVLALSLGKFLLKRSRITIDDDDVRAVLLEYV